MTSFFHTVVSTVRQGRDRNRRDYCIDSDQISLNDKGQQVHIVGRALGSSLLSELKYRKLKEHFFVPCFFSPPSLLLICDYFVEWNVVCNALQGGRSFAAGWSDDVITSTGARSQQRWRPSSTTWDRSPVRGHQGRRPPASR